MASLRDKRGGLVDDGPYKLQQSVKGLTDGDSDLWQLSREEVEAATNGFSNKNVLGEGGFARVFKGQLYGTDVAVKQLKRAAAASISEANFWKEVSILARLRHPHINLLIGCCVEHRSIVTELMEGGSLHDQLSPKNLNPLPWHARFRIALEISSALLHMHIRKILHRDLKPENVLLDKCGNSKLADVGLAKLYTNQATVYSEIRGTYGYVDPHQQMTGQLTRQSDIYALGLVLLQLFTGILDIGGIHKILESFQGTGESAAVGSEQFMAFIESLNSMPEAERQSVLKGNLTDSVKHLVSKASSRWSQGIDKVADSLVSKLDIKAGDWPLEEAKIVLKLSLRCVEKQRECRPDLAEEMVPELYRINDRVKWMIKTSQTSVLLSGIGLPDGSGTNVSKHSRVSSFNSSLDWLKNDDSESKIGAIMGLEDSCDEVIYSAEGKTEESEARQTVFNRFSQYEASLGPKEAYPPVPKEETEHTLEMNRPPALQKCPKVSSDPLKKSTGKSTESTPTSSTPTSPPSTATGASSSQPQWPRIVGWLFKQHRVGLSLQWDKRFYELSSDQPLKLSAYNDIPVTHHESPEKMYILLPGTKIVDKGGVMINGKNCCCFVIQGKGLRPLTLAIDDKDQLDAWIKAIQTGINDVYTHSATKVEESAQKQFSAKAVGRPNVFATISSPTEGEGIDFGKALACSASGVLWVSHKCNILAFKGEDYFTSVSMDPSNGEVTSLMFHTDQTLWSGSEKGVLTKWDWNENTKSLSRVGEVIVFGRISAITCASDGAVWLAHGATVEAFTRGSGGHNMESLCTFRVHTGTIEGLTATPDGLVWSGSRDGSLRAWKKDQGCVRTIQAGIGPVIAVTAGLGDLIWAAGEKGELVAVKEKVEKSIKGGNIICPRAFVTSTNGVLWSGYNDGILKGWLDGKCIFTLIDHDDSILAMAVGPDGSLWTASKDDRILGWKMGR